MPGKAVESPLYRAVLRTDAETRRCPPRRTTSSPRPTGKAIREWIDGDATWPSDARIAEIVNSAKSTGVRVKTSGGLSARLDRIAAISRKISRRTAR